PPPWVDWTLPALRRGRWSGCGRVGGRHEVPLPRGAGERGRLRARLPEEPFLVRLHARQVLLLDRRGGQVGPVDGAAKLPGLARRAHERTELLGEEPLMAVRL